MLRACQVPALGHMQLVMAETPSVCDEPIHPSLLNLVCEPELFFDSCPCRAINHSLSC